LSCGCSASVAPQARGALARVGLMLRCADKPTPPGSRGRWLGQRLLKRAGVVELAPLGTTVAVAAALDPLRPRGRPLKGRCDLVGVDLGRGPLVALGGLPRAGPQPAQDHGAVAL